MGNNNVWDVQEDGSVRRASLVLESRQPLGIVQSMVGKAGTGTAVVTYAGTGSVLAWWWGSSGVVSAVGNIAFWPAVIGFKALSLLFWPVLLVGAAGVGGWAWIKSRSGIRRG